MKDKRARRLWAAAVAAVTSVLAARPVAGQSATRSIDVGNIHRSYSVHVPASAGSGPHALVFVFHGAGGTGRRIAAHTGFDRVADRGRFIVVYPDGVDRRWNDGRRSSSADDIAFVRILLDSLRREFRIDSARVFATGISNGAMFAHRVACDLPGVFAAIAPVAGALPEPLAPRCTGNPISMLALQGTDDRLVPFDGGSVGAARGAVLSARATASHWAEVASCRTNPTIHPPVDRMRDGTRVQRIAYQGCEPYAIELYAILGGGHTWPGGPTGRSAMMGRTTRELDASELIWEFFRTHPKP